MMKPSDILIEARALIDQPQNWTQYVYMRDKEGVETKDYAQASSYCGLGAIMAVYHKHGTQNKPVFQKAQIFLEKAVALREYPDFNDHPDRTHHEVIKAFDWAIANAQESYEELLTS
jgi:hypothetical protein